MDSTITTSLLRVAPLAGALVLPSPLVTRGLRYDPLRDFQGNLITDFEGNVLFEITATYRSVMTDNSFITGTI